MLVANAVGNCALRPGRVYQMMPGDVGFVGQESVRGDNANHLWISVYAALEDEAPGYVRVERTQDGYSLDLSHVTERLARSAWPLCGMRLAQRVTGQTCN